jgi:hypothetical protein
MEDCEQTRAHPHTQQQHNYDGFILLNFILKPPEQYLSGNRDLKIEIVKISE